MNIIHRPDTVCEKKKKSAFKASCVNWSLFFTITQFTQVLYVDDFLKENNSPLNRSNFFK